MGTKRSGNASNFLPGDIRDDCRQEQINAIKLEVRSKYRDRIRAAKSKEEKRAFKKDCEAEIAELIEPLIQEGKLDTPESL